MTEKKPISDKDQLFMDICNTSDSVQEAKDRLGVKDTRSFKRRRAGVERRTGLEINRYVSTVPGESVGVGTEDKPDKELATREAKLTGEVRRLRLELTQLRGLAADSAQYNTLIHGMLRQDPSPPKWLTNSKKRSPSIVHGVPTIFLSDFHWDEIVSPAQINHVNRFNRQIAETRLEKIADTTTFLMKEVLVEAPYEGIVVALGGDMLSGYIHDELRENKDGPILDSVMNLSDNLIAFLDRMLVEFGKVYVPCVVGNHGRMDKKVRAKYAVHDNFDWLLYHMIARYYQNNPDIVFQIPEGPDAYYKVYSVRYMLTHGNQFRGGSGIAGPATPWALGNHKKQKRQVAIDQPYDVLMFGHWHTLAWGPNNSYIVNGSLKGYDEYAYNSNFGFEPPKQALWLTHPEHGITHKMEVFADESKEKAAQAWVSVMDAD